MGCAQAIVPKISPRRLEVEGMPRQFFQRFLLRVWKYGVRPGDCSKDFSSEFGSRGCAEVILPKNYLQSL